MGQILYANARTTEAIRREIRNSEESIAKAAIRLKVDPSTLYRYLPGGRSAIDEKT